MQTLQAHLITRIHNNYRIQIEVKLQEVPTMALLPFLQPKRFNTYCKQGCPNYSKKWTCPPHCPEFQDYAKQYTNTLLILFCTQTEQFSASPEEAASLIAYNFTKEELQAWLRETEAQLNGRMIAANSCEICKVCSVEKGLPCYFPEKIRYNMVAFGFDLSQIMDTFFDHNIQWAKPGQEPEYVSSVGAMLLKDSAPTELLTQD